MKEHNTSGWISFLELCLSAKTSEDLSKILDLFLTQEEKEDIAMRSLIVKELLAKNKTQREIAKDLTVSIAKITRGSNELKRQKDNLVQYLKKHFEIM